MSNARIISGDSGRTQAFKNRIINGAMMIDQRNAGASVSVINGTPTYTLDRWAVYCAGANVPVQRVSGTGGFKNALRVTGGAGVTQIAPAQKIESANSYDLVGQSVTLQATFVVAGGSVTPRVTLYYPNSVDNFSANTQFASTSFGTISAGTTVTKSYTFTNLPSGVANGLYVEFAYDSVGAGITVDITGVQLEKGSTATSFDYRPYGTELLLCQRYYEKMADTYYNNAFAYGATQYESVIRFLVEKRATPSIANSGTFQFNGSGINTTTSALGADIPTAKSVLMYKSGLTGFSQGTAMRLMNGSNSYIEISAEL